MTNSDIQQVPILDPSLNAGYLDNPLPTGRDADIIQLLKTTVSDRSLEELAGDLSHRNVPVLVVFAERMASLAVRAHQVAALRAGLMAVSLCFSIGAGREAQMVLPLLWRSAELLGVDPMAEFSKARRPGEAGGEILRQFSRRQPEDRAIKAMGYVEASDEDGFRYRRTW